MSKGPQLLNFFIFSTDAYHNVYEKKLKWNKEIKQVFWVFMRKLSLILPSFSFNGECCLS